MHLKFLWDWSTILFISLFQCLPHVVLKKNERAPLWDGRMERKMDAGEKTKVREWTQEWPQMTRYLHFSASSDLTSHTHLQYHINVKINDYEIYMFIFLVVSTDLNLSELKIFVRTFLKSRIKKCLVKMKIWIIWGSVIIADFGIY